MVLGVSTMNAGMHLTSLSTIQCPGNFFRDKCMNESINAVDELLHPLFTITMAKSSIPLLLDTHIDVIDSHGPQEAVSFG